MNHDEMIKRLGKGEDPLELAIQKWQDIVDGKGTDIGHLNCALCETYGATCSSCPINKEKGGCGNTPYNDYCHADDKQDTKGALKHAKRELKFLKSLRKAKA